MGLYFCWRSWTSCLDTWYHGFYQIQQVKKLFEKVWNLIMAYVWIFQPYNNPNTNLKNNTKMGHWAQNQAYRAIPVLWPEPCRRWVNWREEAPSWICESKGSGVILDEGMVSDLLLGVLWPEPCRRWVNWREEAPSWICESKGSGVILDEGMISDLLSGVL